MSKVRAFEEGSAQDRELLGGKGANLAEMVGLELPVPPGFTVTTEACREYLETGELSDDLWAEIEREVDALEEKMDRQLGDGDAPLLVSVRSGAPASMPGMMDTVLNLGIGEAAAEGLARETDERFARDAHRRFVEMFGQIVLGIDAEAFAGVRDEVLGEAGVDDASELDADRLADLIDREHQLVRDETGEDLPSDPRDQLRRAIAAVFGSWDNDRAREYRRMEGIPDELGTAVNVQAMVFGNRGQDSATGVAFSRDPSTGEPRPYGDWLRDAQGEDVVAGVRVTEDLADLADQMPDIHTELTDILTRLEQHYREVQDVEFTVEDGRLWILQTRTGKRSAQAALRIAVDLVDEGIIDEDEAVRRVSPEDIDRLLHPQFDPDADYEVLTTGLAASPGAASGEVVLTADEAQRRGRDGDAVILVRTETSPDDVHGLAAARGVLTTRGGLVSHAAIVARSIGKPAVCGAHEVEIDGSGGSFRVGDVTVSEGDVISLDGATGEVVVGEVELVEPQPDERFHRLLGWADDRRRLGVRANADTAEDAGTARELGADGTVLCRPNADTAEDAGTARELGAEGIGLCRTEHMFLGDRVPLVRRFVLAADDDARTDALDELQSAQEEDFAGLLEAMDGLPVTVRLLDAPLHEFLPDTEELIAADATGDLDDEGQELLEAVRTWTEQNPMLGTRAVRLAVLYPDLYRMQVRALVRAARRRREDGGDPHVQVMIPLVITGAETSLAAGWVRETAAEVDGDGPDLVIGAMIETPSAALLAEQIAAEAQFLSFGTNDLTQMTLGFSRDDVASRVVQPYVDQGLLATDPFQSVHEATVGRLVQLAVEGGRRGRDDLELGICGEHGGDPASIRFFDEVGLAYVSCSPFRVPVARLAAAHAALAARDEDR